MNIIIRTSLFVSLICISLSVFADPPTPPADPSNGGGTGPVGAPIDGGLGILLAMGAVYGGTRYYKERRKKNKEKSD